MSEISAAGLFEFSSSWTQNRKKLARLFRVIRRGERLSRRGRTESQRPPGLELSSFAPYRAAGDRLRKRAIRSE
jgi:hypothetical protein